MSLNNSGAKKRPGHGKSTLESSDFPTSPGIVWKHRDGGKKSSKCCSRTVLIGFLCIFLVLVLVLVGGIVHLKLELDSMKEETSGNDAEQSGIKLANKQTDQDNEFENTTRTGTSRPDSATEEVKTSTREASKETVLPITSSKQRTIDDKPDEPLSATARVPKQVQQTTVPTTSAKPHTSEVEDDEEEETESSGPIVRAPKKVQQITLPTTSAKPHTSEVEDEEEETEESSGPTVRAPKKVQQTTLPTTNAKPRTSEVEEDEDDETEESPKPTARVLKKVQQTTLPTTSAKPEATTKDELEEPFSPTTREPKLPTVFNVTPSQPSIIFTTTEDFNRCAEDEFLCKESQTCINVSLVCDGIVDCSIAPSDEMNCSCLELLPSELICDDVYDCADGSDEENCQFCPKDKRCNNGRCVFDEFVCDGFPDCDFGRDERFCTKLSEDFDTSHIKASEHSGYLMQRVQDQWYPVCYRGVVRDQLSGLTREERTLADICSLQHRIRVSRIQLERVEAKEEFSNYTVYIGSSIRIVPKCISRIYVYAKCPDAICPTTEAVPIEKNPIPFLKSSSADDWPSNAVLYKDGLKHCSATIIGDDVLVTSASCLTTQASEHYFEVKTGAIRYRSTSPFESLHRVESVVIHEEYDPKSLQNNIAILRLETKIAFSTNVRPICLPANSSTLVSSEDSCRILGYDAKYDDQLWDTDIIVRSSCDSYDNELCGELSDGGCNENVGGGLFCQLRDRALVAWYFAGLVSHASACNGSSSGRYVSIASHLDWIEQNVGASGIETKSSCPGIVCRNIEEGSHCVATEEDVCDHHVHCKDASDEIGCPRA